MLLEKQAKVSPYRGMPVSVLNSGEKTTQVSSEPLVIKYFNAGVLTDNVNSAAGTPIIVKLNLGAIKNQLGTALGKFGDSSLSLVSTVIDTEVESTPEMFEAIDLVGLGDGLKKITDRLSNGEYVVDYQAGVIYGKKKNDLILATATYLVGAQTAATSSYTSPVIVRTPTILTTSYVNGSVIGPVNENNQLIVYIDFTKGSLTTAEIKFEFSDDGTSYYQETFSALSGGTDTMSIGEHSMGASGAYRIAVPIKDKYIKISAKGTGTVTGSSMGVNAIIGNV